MDTKYEKKVLLREGKRHTDHGVPSTPSVTPMRGTPPAGVPLARSDRGYPRWGTPPSLVRSDGGYPRWGPQQGYPPLARSDGGDT